MSKNLATLKSGSEVTQGHGMWHHSVDRCGFLLVFVSNFVPKTHCSACNAVFQMHEQFFEHFNIFECIQQLSFSGLPSTLLEFFVFIPVLKVKLLNYFIQLN